MDPSASLSQRAAEARATVDVWLATIAVDRQCAAVEAVVRARILANPRHAWGWPATRAYHLREAAKHPDPERWLVRHWTNRLVLDWVLHGIPLTLPAGSGA